MWYSNEEFHTVVIFLNRHMEQKQELEVLQSSSVTASYSGMPMAHAASRVTENIATKQLPAYDQKWYDAIERALAITNEKHEGYITTKLIEMMYFSKSKKAMDAAAHELHISDRSASRRKGEFFALVLTIRKGMDDK